MFSRFDRSRYSQQLWELDRLIAEYSERLLSSDTLSAAVRIMSEKPS
jgi:hypothetical protein